MGFRFVGRPPIDFRPRAALISRGLFNPTRATVAFAAAVGLGAPPFVPRLVTLAGVAVLAALTVAAARASLRAAFTTALISAVAVAAWTVPIMARMWPAPLLLGLAVAGAVARARRDADAFGWLRRGSFGPAIVGWTVLTAAASGAALLLWWAILRPSFAERVVFPPLPVALTVALALAWSVLNAFAEECVFRGALLEALGAGTRNLAAALIVQALAFGGMHFRGVPGGAIGVALAGAYGWMLGAIRLRAGGLLAPIVAHVAADVVVMAIMLVLAR